MITGVDKLPLSATEASTLYVVPSQIKFNLTNFLNCFPIALVTVVSPHSSNLRNEANSSSILVRLAPVSNYPPTATGHFLEVLDSKTILAVKSTIQCSPLPRYLTICLNKW